MNLLWNKNLLMAKRAPKTDATSEPAPTTMEKPIVLTEAEFMRKIREKYDLVEKRSDNVQTDNWYKKSCDTNQMQTNNTN